jgi:cyclophilin family peptidyl-prolyl cis-trans isomerase
VSAQDTIRVRIATEAGWMTAELYAKAAPQTVANFLRYVDGGYYGQGFAGFGRVIEGMDVARRINAMPAQGQSLRLPVRILRIERVVR